MSHIRVGKISKHTQLRRRPALRSADEAHVRFVQSATPHTRHTAFQLLGDVRIAHRAKQSILLWRPGTAVFPTLGNAQRMPLQLHGIPCSSKHSCHHGIRSLAEQFNLAPRPANSLRGKNRDAKRFTFRGDGVRTTSEQPGHFLVTHSAQQSQFVIRPAFPPRRAGKAPTMQIKQPIRLPEHPRDLAVRFRADDVLNRQPLSGGKLLARHDALHAKNRGPV